MGLNKSVGNMYKFVSHTWNTIKGECPHGCTYCYMHRWGKQKPVHFDEKEFKTDLGSGNFIFVGSSCDMFAYGINREWKLKTVRYLKKFDNSYLFQTKDPCEIPAFLLPKKSVICTTIETNRTYSNIMNNSPEPWKRALFMERIKLPKYVTIEPIMDFDLIIMVELIKQCDPIQVNIGSDTGNNNLPEPSKEEILALISELEKFTVVKQKTNLKRLLK